MANEELTIAKEKARLAVIGNSYPDTLTDSGLGFDLSQIIFNTLIDLGLDLPDIDFDDLDDITVIIGIDPDTEIVTLEYPDPEWEEPEWPDPDISDHDWPEPDWPDNDLPDIISYPLPDLDWDDFIDKLEEDFDLDPDILKDLSFTGLDDLGIPTLVSLDEDFNIQEDELPASIEIVTPPKKLEYHDGERIDFTGMVVTAKKADGSTWTSAKYPNGHIPLGELGLSPLVISCESVIDTKSSPYLREYGIDADYVVSQDYSGLICGSTYLDQFGDNLLEQYGYARNPYPDYYQMKAFSMVTNSGYSMILCFAAPDGGRVSASYAQHTYISYKNGVREGAYIINEHSAAVTEIEGKEVLIMTPISIAWERSSSYHDYTPIVYTGLESAIQAPNGLTPMQKLVLAWTLFFGTSDGEKKIPTDVTVNVSWARPVDSLVLTTQFVVHADPVTGNGGR